LVSLSWLGNNPGMPGTFGCCGSCHRGCTGPIPSNDVAVTRLIFEAKPGSSENSNSRQSLFDPDGHYLVIVDSITSKVSSPANAAANADLLLVSAKPE
jgi:hypothetical protein